MYQKQTINKKKNKNERGYTLIEVLITMAVLSIGVQLYLAYGTFLAYSKGGVISAAVLIGTGLPMYYYFRK